jgi:hypothetical protein
MKMQLFLQPGVDNLWKRRCRSGRFNLDMDASIHTESESILSDWNI